MAAFGASFLKYVIIMLILIAMGFLGGFIGVQIRKAKDKHDAAKTSEVDKE